MNFPNLKFLSMHGVITDRTSGATFDQETSNRKCDSIYTPSHDYVIGMEANKIAMMHDMLGT
jgi:hypothetical protein